MVDWGCCSGWPLVVPQKGAGGRGPFALPRGKRLARAQCVNEPLTTGAGMAGRLAGWPLRCCGGRKGCMFFPWLSRRVHVHGAAGMAGWPRDEDVERRPVTLYRSALLVQANTRISGTCHARRARGQPETAVQQGAGMSYSHGVPVYGTDTRTGAGSLSCCPCYNAEG